MYFRRYFSQTWIRLATVLLLAGLFETAKAQDKAAASPGLPEMIARANALTDLSAIGTYELHAQIVVDPASEQAQRGEITIYRDHNRSRLELQLGDFRQLEIVSGGTRYVWRSRAYPAIGLETLEGLEQVVQMRTVFPPKTELGESHKKEIEGIAALCFEAKGPYTAKMRFCFDRQTGTVLEASDSFGWRGRFMDYAPAGPSIFPTRIEFKEDVAPRHAELSAIRVASRKFDTADFVVPREAHAFAVCSATTRAFPVTGTEWSIPSRQKGEVYLYAIVEADGSAHDITAYGTKSKRLQRHVKQSALNWNFAPARCGGTAVASEILLPLKRVYSYDWLPEGSFCFYTCNIMPPNYREDLNPEPIQDQTPSK